jgi:dephospho-CoA kinase
MLLIALTGGIASGKSTVSRWLAGLGATILDADVVARDVVDPGRALGRETLARIVERFGSDVLTASGELDRARLGDLVFPDAAARAALNGIIHPAITTETVRQLDELRRDASVDVVVHEIPLLTTSTRLQHWSYDSVVVVTAPVQERMRRLTTSRGLTEEAARARIAAQPDDEERLPLADAVIDTAGSLADAEEQTLALWHRLTRT